MLGLNKKFTLFLLLLITLVMQSVIADTTKASGSSVRDELYEDLDGTADYPDVDNVEWHHVKMVDGIYREDHPVIMYKEDFVSEDYDPAKSHSNESKKIDDGNHSVHKPHRKYKDISHRRRHKNRNGTSTTITTAAATAPKETEKYNMVKPEKIFFDVLSPVPIVQTTDDSAFDPSDIRVEVIPLVGEENETTPETTKEALQKHPKKYQRHRVRRDVNSEDTHTLRKRNPYYQVVPNSYINSVEQVPPYNAYSQHRTSVPGKYWNGLNGVVEQPPDMPTSIGQRFGGELNTDRVIWPSRNIPRRQPINNERPPPSIFHNSNPENADTSFVNRGPQVPDTNADRRRPLTERPPPSIFHDSRPENADVSFFQTSTQRPTAIRTTPRATTARPRAPSPSDNEVDSITPCIWGIVNCCQSANLNIRYSCFERIGCNGVFWDLNPCADYIRDPIVERVSDMLG